MAESRNKPLMRSLGEFVGHIYRAVRTSPGTRRVVLDKRVEREEHNDMTLRRTTIEEIEFHEKHTSDR